MITESIRRNALAHPDQTALIFEIQRLSWRQFNERINRVANRLSRLGLSQGDRVAVVCPNCLELPEILLGALKAGAVIVPVSTELPPEAVAKALQHANPRAIFAGYSALPLTAGYRKLCTRVVVEGREEGWLTYEGFLLAGAGSEPAHAITGEDLCAIEMTHGELLESVRDCCRAYDLRADSVSLIAAPMDARGARSICWATMLAGGTVVVMRSFNPDEFLRLARDEKCTHALVKQEIEDCPDSIKNEIRFVEFV